MFAVLWPFWVSASIPPLLPFTSSENHGKMMSGVSEMGEAMVEAMKNSVDFEIIAVTGYVRKMRFHFLVKELPLSVVGVRRSGRTRHSLYNRSSTKDSISAVYPPVLSVSRLSSDRHSREVVGLE
jgi:hypothetical protein